MKLFRRAAPAVLAAVLLAAQAGAAEPLKKLSDKLQKGLKDQPNKKVAVLSFSYAGGGTSSGSNIVQERLTTFLVQGGGVEVVERSLLAKLLEENKLEAAGVLDSKTTQELGKVLGVSAIVTGTLNDLPKDKTEVNARVIETGTGKILAAAQTQIERTWTDAPVRPTGTTVQNPVAPTTPTGPLLGKPLVQLAILLDTSSSMDGLIQQARTQLWKIVNELARAEKGGGGTEVQVALYEYGNDGLGQASNWIRQVSPFTKDLDVISEKLFALKTNGGQEYCGAVVRQAVDGLKWDEHADVYKVIFIAGNEPFTQGPVDFREAMAAAQRKGIAVNTVFCGDRPQGLATMWKAGAELGGGEFSNIDQNVRVAQVAAPQDDEILKLNAELNGTFIPYGVGGRQSKEKQEAQDSAVASVRGVAAERAAFKAAAPQYAGAAASWDAVSAVASGRLKESELKTEELPVEMQKLDAAGRKAYIEKKAAERKALQEKIQRLSEQRRRYVAEKEKELAGKGAPTLDAAVLSAVRGQAAKKGFRFKN